MQAHGGGKVSWTSISSSSCVRNYSLQQATFTRWMKRSRLWILCAWSLTTGPPLAQ